MELIGSRLGADELERGEDLAVGAVGANELVAVINLNYHILGVGRAVARGVDAVIIAELCNEVRRWIDVAAILEVGAVEIAPDFRPDGVRADGAAAAEDERLG